MAACGSSRDPSTSTTLSPSKASTVATTSINPSLMASIDVHIDQGGYLVETLDAGQTSPVGDRQSEFAEITEVGFPRRPAHRIGDADRAVIQRQRNQVARQAAGKRAQHDVRRRAGRQPDFGGPARREVVRDLHPRRAGAHHQHPLVRVRRRVAVRRRVQHLDRGAVGAREFRNARCVLVSVGDHHLARIDVARRGL